MLAKSELKYLQSITIGEKRQLKYYPRMNFFEIADTKNGRFACSTISEISHFLPTDAPIGMYNLNDGTRADPSIIQTFRGKRQSLYKFVDWPRLLNTRFANKGLLPSVNKTLNYVPVHKYKVLQFLPTENGLIIPSAMERNAIKIQLKYYCNSVIPKLKSYLHYGTELYFVKLENENNWCAFVAEFRPAEYFYTNRK